MSEQAPEPQHWPADRMIREGHAEYADSADLEGLPDPALLAIAQICEVETYAPNECIPCLAGVVLAERAQEARNELLNTPPGGDPGLERQQPEPNSTVPVVDRFASHVRMLNSLVDELLSGPPIPPPEVSQAELAALVVGAEKWLANINSQGLELAPNQERIRAEIQRVIEKVKRSQQ